MNIINMIWRVEMMRSGLRRAMAPQALVLKTLVPRTFILVGLMSTVACSDLSRTALPAGLTDPSTYNTEAGALRLYGGAVYSFTGGLGVSAATGGTASSSINGNNGAFSLFVLASGVLTDELQAGNVGGTVADYVLSGSITPIDSLDARLFPEELAVYTALQNVRGTANQAIGALATYAPTISPALRGHLYALEGYAELALADLYCSGVPLSTLDFNADFTYRAGSTTTEVYQHALALFDTAITLSADSVRILTLAQIGQGRALLALGRSADAAQAVTSVPTTYQYAFYVNWGTQSGLVTACTLFECPGFGDANTGMTVADGEGGNGLPYISSSDPRSAADSFKVNQFSVTQYVPVKYSVLTPHAALTLAPLVVASGVEARLIEAEAALQAGSSEWLTILNTLRTTCTDAASCPAPAPAGTGGVAGLPPLSDPGSDAARVTLLFTERAYWLFLSGERQGDLRRLVRNYKRDPEAVYPTGDYPIGAQLPRYGRDVSVNIPAKEYANPKFTGCLSRGA
jgi:hypothetical protein